MIIKVKVNNDVFIVYSRDNQCIKQFEEYSEAERYIRECEDIDKQAGCFERDYYQISVQKIVD
jgi:hypothetical protein